MKFVWPVTYDERSEARNKAVLAHIFRGSASFKRDFVYPVAFDIRGRFSHSVRIKPGRLHCI
jgi:hypothetical protein